MGLWTAEVSYKLLPLDYLVFVSYAGFFPSHFSLEYIYTHPQIFECHILFFNQPFIRRIFHIEIH